MLFSWKKKNRTKRQTLIIQVCLFVELFSKIKKTSLSPPRTQVMPLFFFFLAGDWTYGFIHILQSTTELYSVFLWIWRQNFPKVLYTCDSPASAILVTGCVSYFKCCRQCTWQEELKVSKGLWLTVLEYCLSQQGSYSDRKLTEFAILYPQSRSTEVWMFSPFYTDQDPLPRESVRFPLKVKMSPPISVNAIKIRPHR